MLLWVAEGRLAAAPRAAIDQAATVLVSAASVWEIEIKRAIGRLKAPDDLLARLDSSGFERLPISLEHGQAAGRLPLLHGDPFDRMLVAQAQMEGLTVATADPLITRYDVAALEIAQA